MAKYITSEAFRTAFKKVWDEECITNKEQIIKDYDRDHDLWIWTDYMLKGEECFLKKVMYELNNNLRLYNTRELTARNQFFYVDLAYTSGEDLLGKSKVHALIEHENNGDVQTEMHRLLLLRCPLKVIIFYDYNEEDKQDESNRKWLLDKLGELKKMFTEVNKHLQENENTHYLFIIGNFNEKDDLPQWRYATLYSKDGLWLLSNLDDI